MVIDAGIIDAQDTSFIAIDLDELQLRLGAVKSAFGEYFQHTVAVKTNPLKPVLSFIAHHGFGLECASFEEVVHAQSVQPVLVAWDSPAKDSIEIDQLRNAANLLINANNLRELNAILEHDPKGKVALRINPMISTSSHASMSVSGDRSKFGEPISNRSAILEELTKGRVHGLHVHASSQTKAFDSMVRGVQEVVSLAMEINERRSNTIKFIDIGGGFPAAYSKGESFDIDDYASQLAEACPALFDGQIRGITEFGRYYHANAGFTAARIHDARIENGHQVIISHAGADQFLRETYHPEAWHHDLFIIRDGALVTGDYFPTDVGGPLCFGADYLEKNYALPKVQQGDWLIIRDTGANTFSLWSKHCSRAFPKVVSAGKDPGILKDRQSVAAAIEFWG